MSHWNRVHHEGIDYRKIGVDKYDGTLWNPNGYPEDIVRAAVAHADDERHERRSAAAKRAAETRRLRKERAVFETVRRLKAGDVIHPRNQLRNLRPGPDRPAVKSTRHRVGLLGTHLGASDKRHRLNDAQH